MFVCCTLDNGHITSNGHCPQRIIPPGIPLEHLHSMAFQHKVIKPGNILLPTCSGTQLCASHYKDLKMQSICGLDCFFQLSNGIERDLLSMLSHLFALNSDWKRQDFNSIVAKQNDVRKNNNDRHNDNTKQNLNILIYGSNAYFQMGANYMRCRTYVFVGVLRLLSLLSIHASAHLLDALSAKLFHFACNQFTFISMENFNILFIFCCCAENDRNNNSYTRHTMREIKVFRRMKKFKSMSTVQPVNRQNQQNK